jgi:hypothetical protein
MTTTPDRIVGTWRDVTLGVAAWDAVKAPVDVAFACMFTRELTKDGPSGGLLHLDQALSGALQTLREAGNFRAGPLETLVLNRLPAGIAAKTVVVIGLGDPTEWSPDCSTRAVAVAVRTAIQSGAQSAAFAPSILDAGIKPTSDFITELLEAALDTIDAQHAVASSGLTTPSTLRNWVFGAGPARVDSTADQFAAALAARQTQSDSTV